MPVLPAPDPELSQHKHIERRSQGQRNFVSDRNASARNAEDKNVRPVGIFVETLGKESSCLSSIGEHHLVLHRIATLR